jgi:hypothetical protein
MLGKGRPRLGFTRASVLACMVLMRVSCWLLLTGTSFCRGVWGSGGAQQESGKTAAETGQHNYAWHVTLIPCFDLR